MASVWLRRGWTGIPAEDAAPEDLASPSQPPAPGRGAVRTERMRSQPEVSLTLSERHGGLVPVTPPPPHLGAQSRRPLPPPGSSLRGALACCSIAWNAYRSPWPSGGSSSPPAPWGGPFSYSLRHSLCQGPVVLPTICSYFYGLVTYCQFPSLESQLCKGGRGGSDFPFSALPGAQPGAPCRAWHTAGACSRGG